MPANQLKVEVVLTPEVQAALLLSVEYEIWRQIQGLSKTTQFCRLEFAAMRAVQEGRIPTMIPD